jgi:hypothetical protein
MIRKTVVASVISVALMGAIALAPASARQGGGGGGGGHGGGGGGHGGGGHGMGGHGMGGGGGGIGMGGGRGFAAGHAFHRGGNFHGERFHRGVRSFAFGGPVYSYNDGCWQWYRRGYSYVRIWAC